MAKQIRNVEVINNEWVCPTCINEDGSKVILEFDRLLTHSEMYSCPMCKDYILVD